MKNIRAPPHLAGVLQLLDDVIQQQQLMFSHTVIH